MPVIQDVLNILGQIAKEVERLPARIKIAANQVTVVTGLSDVSTRLGLVTAGEFRTGNDKEPGFGFSGVRIGYPPFSYENDDWHFAGVNNDVLQFGINADDGKAYAGRGSVILDEDGISIPEGGDALSFEAPNYLQYGIFAFRNYGDNGLSAFDMSVYFLDSETNQISNGDFETGDFTSWTEADPGGLLSVVEFEDGYSMKVDAGGGANNISQSLSATASSGAIVTMKARVSAGSNISSISVGDPGIAFSTVYQEVPPTNEWRTYTFAIRKPNVTDIFVQPSANTGCTMYIDDIVVYPLDDTNSYIPHQYIRIAPSLIEIDNWIQFYLSNSTGYFNYGQEDLNFIFRGDTDANLINIDGGLDAIGIGKAASASYKVDISGGINISTGNTYDINGSPHTHDYSDILGASSYRNLLINGDMQISQRGTSESGVTSSQYGDAPDRWYLTLVTLGTWTLSQDTANAPASEGFGYAYKLDCTAADASPAAGDVLTLSQRIEGQFLQHFKKGTANAESMTLSFWVRSSKTGNFVVELNDQDNGRHICSTVTISSANTWEYKTITFAGDTTGQFDNDNARSLDVFFWLGAGTNYTSGTLATSWASTVNANRAVGTDNWADNTANDIYFTGVQLEVGGTATDFEHLPFDMQLQRCKRYYQLIASGSGKVLGVGLYSSATAIEMAYTCVPEMRDTPSADVVSGSNYYTNLHGDTYDDLNIGGISTSKIITLYNNTDVSGTAYQATDLRTNNASAFVGLNAEL